MKVSYVLLVLSLGSFAQAMEKSPIPPGLQELAQASAGQPCKKLNKQLLTVIENQCGFSAALSIKLLTASGADVNWVDEKLLTPLDYARVKGDSAIIMAITSLGGAVSDVIVREPL